MSQVLAKEATSKLNQLQSDFLQELTKKIRLAAPAEKYQDWTDQQLIEQLVICSVSKAVDSKNEDPDSLYRLSVTAFYEAIGTIVENITKHYTETFVHLKGKEFNSALVFCGGVMVLCSLYLEGQNFCFASLNELVDTADNYIHHALAKAVCYFDF